MQTRLIIEVTVDYLDKNKLPAIITAGRRAAARLNAAVQLLADGQPPNVSFFSDDFYEGKVELEYLHEQLEQEQASSASTRAEIALSDEFAKALKGD